MVSRVCRWLGWMSGVALSAVALAAAPEKRPLTYADADGWRSVNTPTLSRDGRWLAYSWMPQEGDGDVVVRELSTGAEQRWPAGATPPPPFPLPQQVNERQPPAPDVGLQFTSTGEFLLAWIFPTQAEQVAARLAKKKPAEAPKRALLLVALATGQATRVPGVKSVQTPARGGNWAAYLLEPAKSGEKPEEETQRDGDVDATEAKAKPAETTLVLRNLATGEERTFAHVSEYAFARDGRTLVFAVAAPDAAASGVFAVTPGEATSPHALASGGGRYVKLAWDRAQTQLAFLCDHAASGSPAPKFTVYVWRRGEAAAREVVNGRTPGVPAGLAVSENAAHEFSADGRKLYLGVAPLPKPAEKDERDPEEKVNADLWSWTDGLIQPRQAVRADEERKRTFRGILDLATQRYTQLADESMTDVTLSADGRHAVGFDYRPYMRLRDYDGTYGDVYVVDTTTGARRLAVAKLRGASGDEGLPGVSLSPDGRYGAFYADRQWHVLELETAFVHEVTASLPVAWSDETHDEPQPAPGYGMGGWTSDSTSLLIYDRYDVWQVFVDGRAARNLTGGAGRAEKIVYRVKDIAAHEEGEPPQGIDSTQPLVLRGESETTRATGYFRTSFTSEAAPQQLLWGDCDWRFVQRALGADTMLLTASRFDQFPDVWTADSNFAGLQRVTDGQAQLAPFAWGEAELIDYRSPETGEPLQAVLYKPAGFDPRKKYPLIVYTYERLSATMHRFFPPMPGSNISFPLYASNGYCIMLVDIAYRIGHPGESALACVNAALDAVIARGFVDEHALGIQGSSWGGYQAAYLITHTDRFRAAEAGAVVGNMTSAYGGVRWISGQPRLFQYEQTQSRIGAPLTDAPELYLENSPVFHVKNVTTPLLMLHNDRDGAVPWPQSIELFLALRRYEKPVWLFNYHDEGHGLTRRADQKDFSRRMWQFFEHYLRGAPAPEWLTKGVPYLERDEEKRRFAAGGE